MKTAEVDFHFPVLGFTPDKEIWGFADLNTLTSVGPKTLKDDMQSGMELVDVDGRRWVVRSIRKLGRGEPLLQWLLSALLSTRQYRIEQELEPLEPLSLAEVKARVLDSMETFAWDYGGEEELASRLAEVRSAKSIASIHDLIGLDSFMAY